MTTEATTATPEAAVVDTAEAITATATTLETPAASLADMQREKLEAMRIRNAERKAALHGSSLSEREKAVAAQEASTKAKLAEYERDPVKALQAAGYDPLQALDALVANAQDYDRPVTRAELAAHEKRVAEQAAFIKALQDERAAEKEASQAEVATKREREAADHFVTTIGGDPKYSALSAYTPEELVGYGNAIATEWQAAQKRFSFTDVADRLLEGHNAMVRRFSPASGVSDTTSAPATAPATVNGGRQAPRTLTPATDTKRAPKGETTAERVERIAATFAHKKLR